MATGWLSGDDDYNFIRDLESGKEVKPGLLCRDDLGSRLFWWGLYAALWVVIIVAGVNMYSHGD